MVKSSLKYITQLNNINIFKPTQDGRLSLRANFSWMFIGNVIFAASQWGMLIVLAKLGSTKIVGQFAIGLALTAPIIILANLKLRAVLATDAKDEFQFRDYLALRIMMLTLAIALISLVAIVTAHEIRTSVVIMLVGGAKVFDSLSDIMYGFLQQQERMDRIAASRILQGISQLFGLGITMILTHSLVLAVLVWAIISGAVTIGYDLKNVRELQKEKNSSNVNITPRWQWAIIRRLMLYTLPLGLATMLGSLWLNIPRYFIEFQQGEGAVGIFSAIVALMVIEGTIISAIGQAASPRLSILFVRGRQRAFRRLLVKLIAVGLLLGVTGIGASLFWGHSILSAIYTNEYTQYSNVLVWLAISYGIQFCYIFLGTGIQAMRNFKIHFPIQVISILVLLFLCYLFVPSYGMLGAAWAMLGANIVEAVLYVSGYYYVLFTNQAVILSRVTRC